MGGKLTDHVAVRPQRVDGEEGPERLNNDSLETVRDNWKEQKKKPDLIIGNILGGGGGGGR